MPGSSGHGMAWEGGRRRRMLIAQKAEMHTTKHNGMANVFARKHFATMLGYFPSP
jgi:hypothetical protein